MGKIQKKVSQKNKKKSNAKTQRSGKSNVKSQTDKSQKYKIQNV